MIKIGHKQFLTGITRREIIHMPSHLPKSVKDAIRKAIDPMFILKRGL
jgi:hypothetical protein